MRANNAVALPILLEPAQWPSLTARMSFPGFVREKDHLRLLAEYDAYTTELLRQLDAEAWRRVHEEIRFQAATMDENHALYVLLRLAPWERRGDVSGRVGGALWLRHIAEVLRRSFEEAQQVQWPEEDQGLEMWMQGARVREYGSDRPLDRPTASKPYLAFAFGLHTGSIVRWYLEGDTEFGAVTEVLPGAAPGALRL